MAINRDLRPAPWRHGLSVAVLVALLAACSPAGDTGRPSSAPASTTPSGVTKVLTIVLENHGVAAVAAGMPELMKLATTYGRTSHYSATTHPSLPNYLDLAGGSTFGVKDDGPPAAHPVRGPSVFDLALTSGHTARTYAEAMPTACSLTNDGRYAVKHNPWAYFSDDASRRACAVDDAPLGDATSGALHDDITNGTLPNVGFVVPDMCNDAHDCPLATADAWVGGWVSQALQGPDWQAGRLAVVVTFDEAESSGKNTVLTVVVAPGLHGAVADAALTHESWTRWMSDLVGAAAPGDAGRAQSLGAAFGL
jgi:hypothetical protein